MSKKILLVEDEPLIAIDEAQLFRKYGYEVTIAHKGESAVEVLSENSEIDLVLMDIDLGKGIDGTEAADRILRKRDIPIVFLTSHAEKEMVDKVRGISSYGYVLKNSGEFVLIESIRMAFELFEAHQTRKRHEKELEQSEELYRSILQASPNAIVQCDMGGRITFCNDKFLQFLGAENREIMIGTHIFDYISHEERGKAMRQERLLLKRGSLQNLEFTGIRMDGSKIKQEVSLAVMYDSSGRPYGFVGIIRAIHGKREFYRDLKRFRDLLDNVRDGIIIHSRKTGKIVDVNETTLRLSGIAREELLQKSIFELDVGLKDVSMELIERDIVNKGSSTFETTYTRNDGTKIFSEVNLSEMEIMGESYLVSVIRDITRSKEIERTNEERKVYVEAILDSSPSAILTLDTENRIKEWNRGAERLFKYRRDEVLGKNLDKLVAGNESSVYDDACSLTDQVSSGQPVPPTETVRYTKYGETLNVIVAGSPIRIQGIFSGIVATYTDISKLKEAENEVKLLLEEKEQLLREVHHRIKNHMNTISSILSLHADYHEDSRIAQVFEEIHNKIKIMQNIYQNLYTGEDVNSVYLSSFLENIVADLQEAYIYEKHILVEDRIEDLQVSAKLSLPVGIIVNELITNSLKYAFEGRDSGTITLTVCREDDAYLRIEVADDGNGLPEELLSGGEYGFGLTLVEGYARQYKGTMRLYGNGGSRIVVTLHSGGSQTGGHGE